MKAFAGVLRAARLQRGFSQEELAVRASVDRTFVGKLESGRHQPSLAVVFKLADAVGLAPEDLVRMVRLVPKAASVHAPPNRRGATARVV